MHDINAIGFDLFNTLVTFSSDAADKAMDCLFLSLRESYPNIERGSFERAHWDAAIHFLEKARQDNKETHNRFWISAALENLGYEASPDHPFVNRAVEAYFSLFPESCRLIPGTREMLESLKGVYRLGLLSNFTHAPAVRDIIEALGIDQFFDVVLISGELGYRKPHPLVFERLVQSLGFEHRQTLFVGDDLGPDISGAKNAGLHPVWMTYARDESKTFFKGLSYEKHKRLEMEVLKISCWNELQSILESQKPKIMFKSLIYDGDKTIT